ncbi:MAG: helix-turn-helix domain-containing protein [Methanomassiliicoccales archaeon]|nr:helix-turn-helix domain-containing protein [Methanomassiliicoccales archaeon]
MFSLSRNEIRSMISLMDRPLAAKELAQAIPLSLPSAYRILENLESRGFIRSEGAHPRCYLPSDSLHSQALRQILGSGDYPFSAFLDSKMLILLSICYHEKDNNRVAKETGLKKDSLRKYVRELESVGLISSKENIIKIPSINERFRSLLQDYSRGVFNHHISSRIDRPIFQWAGGLDFLFSVSIDHDVDEGSITGPIAMERYGILLVTDLIDRYWSFWKRELRLEDHALFNILIDRTRARISYSLLLLDSKDYDKKYLLQEARQLGLETIISDMVKYLRGKEVRRTEFPSRQEFEQLRRDYGVLK